MTLIFEALRLDHDIQRDLSDQLIKTSGDTPERKKLWNDLKKELEIHAQAEERYFYTTLIHDEMTQKHARHGVSEHHEMDELIQKLNKTEMSEPSWLVYAKQLRDKIYHHLEDEEHTIFQLAGKVLTENQKSSLEKEYRKYMSEHHVGVQ